MSTVLGDLRDSTTPVEVWEHFLEKDLSGAAYQLKEDIVLAVPADLRWRKDSTQVVAYGGTTSIQTFRIMPAQLVVLSLLDGTRTLGEVFESVAELSDCSLEAARLKVLRLLAYFRYPEQRYLIEEAALLRNGREIHQIPLKDLLIPHDQARYSSRLDFPISMMFMVTSACQTNCVYCYACRRHVPNSELLRIERIHELIDECADIGVAVINFDGGDLFARKEACEIIAHVVERGIWPDVSTKCYISKEDARRLADAGLRWLQVGLDAPRPEMADYLVGRTGYLERAIETIHNVAEAGIPVRTNSIITRESLHLLPELLDLLLSLPLVNSKIAPAFRSYFRDNGEITLTPHQKMWLREVMMKAERQAPGRIFWEAEDDVLDLSEEGRRRRFGERAMCSSGRIQMVITPDGKVVTCEQSPQTPEFFCGDCSFQSIEEVWKSKEVEAWYSPDREKFKGTVCYECEHFYSCVVEQGHCWFHALRVHGTPFAPHPECPKAPLTSTRWY